MVPGGTAGNGDWGAPGFSRCWRHFRHGTCRCATFSSVWAASRRAIMISSLWRRRSAKIVAFPSGCACGTGKNGGVTDGSAARGVPAAPVSPYLQRLLPLLLAARYRHPQHQPQRDRESAAEQRQRPPRVQRHHHRPNRNFRGGSGPRGERRGRMGGPETPQPRLGMIETAARRTAHRSGRERP